uniref:Uncharacterized protein n=1 Tax=Arundo donax TaxID=35708 RepID=A0A0A9ARD9_ARUDO
MKQVLLDKLNHQVFSFKPGGQVDNRARISNYNTKVASGVATQNLKRRATQGCMEACIVPELFH